MEVLSLVTLALVAAIVWGIVVPLQLVAAL
jgi:hypothetical protein